MQLADRGQRLRILLHDRDSKFTGGFDEVLAAKASGSSGHPSERQNANAYAERWLGTLRRAIASSRLVSAPIARWFAYLLAVHVAESIGQLHVWGKETRFLLVGSGSWRSVRRSMAELLPERTSGEEGKRFSQERSHTPRLDPRADERGPRTPLDATRLASGSPQSRATDCAARPHSDSSRIRLATPPSTSASPAQSLLVVGADTRLGRARMMRSLRTCAGQLLDRSVRLAYRSRRTEYGTRLG
jgi:hypothetical protein